MIASSMHDNYEIVGGVFNPEHEESLKFARHLGLDEVEFTRIMKHLLMKK